MKQSNTQTLTQLGFFFGFSIALSLSIIYQINYFHLENLDNKSLRVAEGIILFVSSFCYIWNLFFVIPFSKEMIVMQGFLLVALIITCVHQDTQPWNVIHMSIYAISSLVWILHLLFLQKQKRPVEKLPLGI